MAKRKKKKSSSLQVVVASRVKEVVKRAGLRSDGRLADAVNEKLVEILKEAAARRKVNKRGTARPHRNDLDPVHPGEVLTEDFLKPLGVTQSRLARHIGVPARGNFLTGSTLATRGRPAFTVQGLSQTQRQGHFTPMGGANHKIGTSHLQFVIKLLGNFDCQFSKLLPGLIISHTGPNNNSISQITKIGTFEIAIF